MRKSTVPCRSAIEKTRADFGRCLLDSQVAHGRAKEPSHITLNDTEMTFQERLCNYLDFDRAATVELQHLLHVVIISCWRLNPHAVQF